MTMEGWAALSMHRQVGSRAALARKPVDNRDTRSPRAPIRLPRKG
jgi:hypothetical protein